MRNHSIESATNDCTSTSTMSTSSVSTSTTSTSNVRAGFTLVELMIGATILFLLAAGLIESVSSVRSLATSGSVQSRLQAEAETSLHQILDDLRGSGFTTIAGKSYPYVFDGGETLAAFEVHEHDPAQENAEAGDPDFGDDREIVFLRPEMVEVAQDASGTNWDLDDPDRPDESVKLYRVPVLDVSGNAVWDAVEFSYVLVTGADGTNRLERRTNGANPRVVARNIERVTFDTSATDLLGVPLNAVRVRLWFRARDDDGRVQRHFSEALVQLRNT